MIRTAKIFQAIVYWPIYLILKTFFSFKIEGHENLKGFESNSVIFAGNHAHFLDGIIACSAMPLSYISPFKSEWFPIRFLAYRAYFSLIRLKPPFVFPISLLVGGWIRLSACLPVRPRYTDADGKHVDPTTDRSLKDVLYKAIGALKNRQRVFIFPEGSVTRNGKLQKGKRGVACLHKETGVPIIPVGIIGTYKLSLRDVFRRQIIVRFGEPILTLDNPGRCDLETGTKKVMAAIRELL